MIRVAARRALSSASAAKGKQTIGVVGLGNMGRHMAANLLKSPEWSVVVFDVNEAATREVVAKGARAASSPAELARESDVVLTMLPSSPHVKSVYLGSGSGAGAGGIVGAARRGALLVDSSTIDPGTAREVAARAEQAGLRMVDAPVSGGVGGAEKGTLTFMVGGPAEHFEAASPVLRLMGKNIVRCGESGAGQVAKIANNLILGILMVAVSEGMNLGVRLGVDPKVLAGIINTSSGRCWSSDTYNPVPGVMEGVPASRGYTGGFGVDLIAKDLGLAVTAAHDAKVNLPLGSATWQLYQMLSSQAGAGNKDFSVIYEWLASQAKK